MKPKNQSSPTELILLGFSSNVKINVLLFFVFLLIYLVTVTLNVFISFTIAVNRHLHTPMYFFLCNLSFLDLCYSTNCVPRFLVDVFSDPKAITLNECSIQLHVSLFLGSTEYQLLATMAYDRYAAICHPLHCPFMMSWAVCYQLAVFVWVWSFFISVVPSLIMPVVLCFPNVVNHFMCEVISVLKLACEDVYSSELAIFCVSFVSLLLPFVFILVSYACIISSVLKIRAVERTKAFSTCTSHITVVLLCFLSAMILYFALSSKYLENQIKYISVFYVIITPMLNPLIYSVKNKDVKENIRKTLKLITY
ncbi:olfactory receptor 2D2-like [Pelodytes ibericus]